MWKPTRRQFAISAAGAAAASQFPMPAIAKSHAIRIGAVQPFSGGLELFGNQAKLGLDLAAQEINAKGGVLGRKLDILYEDNRTNPKTSVERTSKLIRRDRVLAISGPITSNARDAMTPTIKRLKTPLLYATNYEGGACDPNIFCFNTVPNQELARLLPAMHATAGKSYYMFGANYIWPQKMFETAEKIVAGLGGTVAGKEFTPWGVKDFAPVIRRIKASGAKVLVFALPGADGITFIKQAESLGLMKALTVAFLGFAETYLGAFGKGGGQNMWVTVPFVASMDDPGIKDFVARVKASAGKEVPISHYVMTHYNSIYAVKAALEKSGRVGKNALIAGLQGLTIDTPTGPMSIGARDHHVTFNMFLASTQGKGLKTVKALGRIAPQAGC